MGRIVLAYHGCDVTTRDGLVSGKLRPRISKNLYDWLGDGMYFFEDDSVRALKLAQASRDEPLKLLTKNPIANPSVVGVALDVDRWLDLTTQEGIANFTAGATAVIDAHQLGNTPLPVNTPAFEGDTDLLHRAFDRAACEMVHTYRAQQHEIAKKHIEDTEQIIATAPYQASRGAFEQGDLISNGSSIYSDTHLQIAVHDLKCIKAWFILPGESLLTEEGLALANQQLKRRSFEPKTSLGKGNRLSTWPL